MSSECAACRAKHVRKKKKDGEQRINAATIQRWFTFDPSFQSRARVTEKSERDNTRDY